MNYKKVLAFVLSVAFVGCTEELILPDNGGTSDVPKGEMVMFKVGTTENQSRASEAKTYYMPDCSRFVCRMYYKAQTGSELFDTLGTDQTVWMKVNGNVGNSLYWNKDYAPVPENVEGKGGVDSYGNDYSAPAFYWQNRKEHAFLAWTDLNHATTIKGGSLPGQLKFNADKAYLVYTGANVSKWVPKYYKIYGVDEEFTRITDMHAYVQAKNGVITNGQTDEFKAKQAELESAEGFDWSTDAAKNSYRYSYGWQYKTSAIYAKTIYNTDDPNTATKYENGWVQHLMYFDKIPFDLNEIAPEDTVHVLSDDGEFIRFIKDKFTRKYICSAEVKKDAEGNCLDAEGNVTEDKELYAYDYYLTDEDGNLRYDESKPRYTFYYKQYVEKESTKEVYEYPALVFDMRRKPEMNSMADQQDIVQALTIQAPKGATQEANRVNLYFKHQFSQLQVNVKNAADNSVIDLDPSDIKKVELLGVTDTAYVFTDLDTEGEVRASSYKDIDYSKYSESDLKDNPFGSSLQLFELPAESTEYGYLKSFNGIAFGQLQAIRITWQEKTTEKIHASTYRIPDTELMNLKSGMRYVWNIEIRRGTLAVIRTEVIDWELPTDEDHNANAEGIIQN